MKTIEQRYLALQKRANKYFWHPTTFATLTNMLIRKGVNHENNN